MQNEEEILNKKLEGENEDIDATLPSSNEADVQIEADQDVPELNSAAHPTEDQVEEMCDDAEQCEHDGECDADCECVENELTPEQESVEKMLTQSQVNDIVGRTRTETRDSTLKSVYDRYGVSNDTEMDDVVGRSQKYDLLRDDYDKVIKELGEIKTRLAMYDSGIDPERYEDARLILSGKGKDVTSENILAELETHPEWKKAIATPASNMDEIDETFVKIEPEMEKPVSKITRLGNEPSAEPRNEDNERDTALKLFY